tara:strand:- start:153 stop:797 length:645 start_codon:yes stop_codon:yes gene_type:complete
MFVIILIIWALIINSRKIVIIGTIILIISSLPIVSKKLVAYLESNYEQINLSDIDTADAIVVLSGSPKRIFSGIELFKKNKASSLILTRGKLPWSVGISEGEYHRDHAIMSGIPKNNIILTNNVQNTDQEAKAVRKLLPSDNPKIILVTSAFHMPRAQIVFEAAGIKIIPFPVDYKTRSSKLTFISFIPSANSLSGTSLFFREMIGRAYYDLKY